METRSGGFLKTQPLSLFNELNIDYLSNLSEISKVSSLFIPLLKNIRARVTNQNLKTDSIC